MKKNRTKRALALFLIFLILASLLPSAVFAEGTANSVAEVGGEYYDTLLDAVNHAAEGQTINLLSDFEVPEGSYISYNMPNHSVFDLGGHTLTVPFTAAVFQGENITIQNGRFEGRADYAIWIGNGDKETSATIKNITSNGGINIYAATATLIDTVIDASSKTYYAVWVDNGNAIATIKNGTYIGGKTAVINASAGVNNDGSLTPGKVIVEGGNFIGEVLAEEDKGTGSKGQVFISGGKFSDNVSTYLEAGVKQDLSGAVVPGNPNEHPVFGDVARVGADYFTSLKEAFAAAHDGDVVEVLADVQLTDSVNPGKNVTIRGVGEPKPVISSPKGIFSVTKADATIENLTLEITQNAGHYIYQESVPLTVKNCDFVMGEGVQYVGNLIMNDGTDKTLATDIFTGNRINATSRAALVGLGNGSQVINNTFDFGSETCASGRTSCIGLTATADSPEVVISGNTFMNANRILAVDNSSIPADQLTFRDNRFINCRWAFEMKEDDNRAFDLNYNYYQFGSDEPCAPKIENADGNAGHTNPDNELKIAPVSNNVYYTTENLADGVRILLSSDKETLYTNEEPKEVTLTADVIGIHGLDLVWSSGRPSVATVENGVVTAAATGSTVITAEAGNFSASCAVTVRGNSSTPIYIPEVKKQDPPSPVIMTFEDVAEGAWYYDAIKYVYENKLMQGTDDSSFSPESNTTRAMVITILYRLSGEPEAGSSQFADVSPDAYYAKAVAWGAANGIVSGYNEKTFAPNDNITREQLAAILNRYARFKDYDVSHAGDLSAFTDVDQISGYAIEHMKWAVAAGLVTGMTESTLNAQGDATRAQVALILFRFCKSVAE